MSKRMYIGEVRMLDRIDSIQYSLFKKTETGIKNCTLNFMFDSLYKKEEKVRVRIYIGKAVVVDVIGWLFKKKKFGNYEWFIKRRNGKEVCFADTLFRNINKRACFIIQYGNIETIKQG